MTAALRISSSVFFQTPPFKIYLIFIIMVYQDIIFWKNFLAPPGIKLGLLSPGLDLPLSFDPSRMNSSRFQEFSNCRATSSLPSC